MDLQAATDVLTAYNNGADVQAIGAQVIVDNAAPILNNVTPTVVTDPQTVDLLTQILRLLFGA